MNIALLKSYLCVLRFSTMIYEKTMDYAFCVVDGIPS